MTIAELNRAVRSFNRKEKQRAKETAVHNYILAGLIGSAFASAFSEEASMPRLEEVYSALFEDKAEETKKQIEEKKQELSVIRFTQFANSHNNKFKQQEVAKSN